MEYEELTAACRGHGLKLTPQRIAVYRVIRQLREHPSVEVIFSRVREELPGISLDTVYRICHTLASIGLIRRLRHGEAVRYDSCLLPHHHFVCRMCNGVWDVAAAEWDLLPSHLSGIGAVESSERTMYGVCDSCAKKQ